MFLVFVKYVIRDLLPNYLRTVPIPRSCKEVFLLTWDEAVQILTFTATCTCIICAFYQTQSKNVSSQTIDFRNVENFAIEIDDRKTLKFCRCLKSTQFPYCDGSHNAFNNNSSEDIFPLVVTKRMDVPLYYAEQNKPENKTD